MSHITRLTDGQTDRILIARLPKSLRYGSFESYMSSEYDNKMTKRRIIDCVKLVILLSDIGVDWRHRKLIEELYGNQSAFVKFGG